MRPHSPATDWVLIESSGRGESEDDFLVLSGRDDSDPEVQTISGAAALLDALRELAPRRVVFDFQGSFRRGLDLLRTLRLASPELKLVARVRSPGSKRVEPLYFSIDVQTSRVSLHRMIADPVALPASERESRRRR